MSTFAEIMKRREFLQAKKEAFEKIKDSVNGIVPDQIILDEILLDLDEKCVAPVLEEIEAIDWSSFVKRKPKTDKITEKKDVKAKKERKSKVTKDSEKKKRSRNSSGKQSSNTKKRSC